MQTDKGLKWGDVYLNATTSGADSQLNINKSISITDGTNEVIKLQDNGEINLSTGKQIKWSQDSKDDIYFLAEYDGSTIPQPRIRTNANVHLDGDIQLQHGKGLRFKGGTAADSSDITILPGAAATNKDILMFSKAISVTDKISANGGIETNGLNSKGNIIIGENWGNKINLKPNGDVDIEGGMHIKGAHTNSYGLAVDQQQVFEKGTTFRTSYSSNDNVVISSNTVKAREIYTDNLKNYDSQWNYNPSSIKVYNGNNKCYATISSGSYNGTRCTESAISADNISTKNLYPKDAPNNWSADHPIKYYNNDGNCYKTLQSTGYNGEGGCPGGGTYAGS